MAHLSAEQASSPAPKARDVAVSGSISGVEFDTAKVIEIAFRRCRLPPQRISGELVTLARDSLYLILSEWGSIVQKLWVEERLVLALEQGRAAIPLPAGSLGVVDANLRTTARLTGTIGSRLGGITVTLDSAAQVPVIGFTPAATGTYSLIFEAFDGTSWKLVGAADAQLYTAGTRYWGDIDAAPTALAICVRDANAISLTGSDIYAGSSPREVPMTKSNKSTYRQIPNKTAQGRPFQYVVDKQRDGVVLNVWQTANADTASNCQLVIWRKRHIMDPGAMTDTLDIPQAWFNAIVAALAYQLALDSIEVDPGLAPGLKMVADEKLAIALAGETDNAPVTINYGIRRYTR